MAAQDVEVRASAIEGLGVFALRPCAPGERIRRVNIVREVTPEAPLREELGERIEHCGYPDGKVVLWGYPDRHVNHSCDPNAYELYEDEAVFIAPRRAIEAGEELTFDYNVNTAGGSSATAARRPAWARPPATTSCCPRSARWSTCRCSRRGSSSGIGNASKCCD